MSREFAKDTIFTFRGAVKLPIAATAKQVEEWIAYNTDARCLIGAENPLINFDLNASSVFGVVAES